VNGQRLLRYLAAGLLGVAGLFFWVASAVTGAFDCGPGMLHPIWRWLEPDCGPAGPVGLLIGWRTLWDAPVLLAMMLLFLALVLWDLALLLWRKRRPS
jgi:hypothetical protein